MRKEAFSFLTLLLLFTTPTLAQDLVNRVISILPQFVGVIFILIFILILLLVGGVMPKPKGGLPIGVIAFLILIILLFVVPQFVPFPEYLDVPENFKKVSLPKEAVDVLELIGLPRSWGYVPAIIYLFILPFAAIYTLVWAFLTSIKIFEGIDKINRLLAFIITFLTIPLGWFIKIVWILFGFMGIWSVVVFGATFILGIFFKGYGVVGGEYYKSMAKRWRDDAKKYLNNAITNIQNRQAGLAQDNLNAANKIVGFSTNYYNKIAQATNALAQQPPDWTTAENAVKDALKEIS